MRKILLATSVFALSVGIAMAQSTGSVTPSPATPSTTGTFQGTTSTQPGTTSSQTGTTSTTGDDFNHRFRFNGNIANFAAGKHHHRQPRDDPGNAGRCRQRRISNRRNARHHAEPRPEHLPRWRHARLPKRQHWNVNNGEQHAFTGNTSATANSGTGSSTTGSTTAISLRRAELQRPLLTQIPASREAPPLRAARRRRRARPHPAILRHQAIWERDLQLQLSHRNRLVAKGVNQFFLVKLNGCFRVAVLLS